MKDASEEKKWNEWKYKGWEMKVVKKGNKKKER